MTDEEKRRSFGERIKERRLQLKMTQTELAQRSGYKEKSSIAKIESGQVNTPIGKVVMIAFALNTSAAFLLGKTDDPDAPYDGKSAGYEIKALEGLLDEEHQRMVFNKLMHTVLNEHMESLSRICTDDKTEFFSSTTAWRIQIVTRFMEENEDFLRFKFMQYEAATDPEE